MWERNDRNGKKERESTKEKGIPDVGRKKGMVEIAKSKRRKNIHTKKLLI